MNILRNLVEKKIHLWVVFILFLALLGGEIFWTQHYHPALNEIQVMSPTGVKTALAYGAEPALSNPDFYASVEKDLIEKKTSFIDANLSSMKLSVYQNGSVVKTVPILAKGKKGSWWETPAGLYKVESKIKKHESSFSPVYTDWNLNFQGNFFIHGWPYWVKDGAAVGSTYSGGCIRLDTADAKEVYDLASVGMPVLVYEEAASSPYSYSANVPDITSTNYLAADLQNNYVFLKNNSETPVDLPSAEKLLTALVGTEYMDIERGVKMNGKNYTVYDVLFPLLLKGDENAAKALRSELGSNYSVNLMNAKAKSIGMSETTISKDSDTLTSSSTAEDMFHLAQYLLNYRKFILDLSRGVVTNNAYGPSAFGNVVSTSPIKDLTGYLGGSFEKNDSTHTESVVSIFSVPFGTENRSIAIIVLNSTDTLKDVQSILDYVKTSYK